MSIRHIFFSLIRLTFFTVTLSPLCAASPHTESSELAWIADWKNAPPMSLHRTGHSTLVTDNILHAIGGTDKNRFNLSSKYSRFL